MRVCGLALRTCSAAAGRVIAHVLGFSFASVTASARTVDPVVTEGRVASEKRDGDRIVADGGEETHSGRQSARERSGSGQGRSRVRVRRMSAVPCPGARRMGLVHT